MREGMKGTSREHQGRMEGGFGGTFSEYTGDLQGAFRESSGSLHGIFRKPSGN
jgi:hypothetical protein